MKQLTTILLVCLMPILAIGQYSIKTESDTTIVATQSWYGIKITTRYYFKEENAEKASQYIQLASLPYNGLNDKAQKEMKSLSRYIRKTENIPYKSKKK